MLIRFGVKNHLSIRDYQELSCVASAGYHDLDHTIVFDELPQKKQSFLPVIAIYGANAAGKSNILDAVAFFENAIRRSYFEWDEMELLPQRYFSLDSASLDVETLYDCDFIFAGVRYQYGFSFTRKSIMKEWLYAYPKGTRNILFQRDFTDQAELTTYFGQSLKKVTSVWKAISENTKVLMLSAAGRKENEHDQLTPIYNYFKQNLNQVKINNEGMENTIAKKIQSESIRSKVVEILKTADFGIVGIELETVPFTEETIELTRGIYQLLKTIDKTVRLDETPERFPPKEQVRINFRHDGCEGKTYLVRFDDESSGTRYLLRLLVPVINALENGSTLIVDEITTNLHTKISEGIVRLFTSPETNKKNAQFIFSTHDTNLLSRELLRRDEIWFAEKDYEGATCIYPLSDFKTRKADNIEKGYLQGRFGAIPFVGNIATLLS